MCVWMLTHLDTFSAANEEQQKICWRRGAVPWSLTKSFGLPLHRRTPNLSGQRVKSKKKNKLLPPVCILGQFPVRWVDIWREAPLPAEILDQRWEGVSQGQWGWVRRHVQNWHSALPVSWMVSVSTTMVKISYFLSVRSGVAKAVGNVAVSLWCGLINILHGNCSIIYTTVPPWWGFGDSNGDGKPANVHTDIHRHSQTAPRKAIVDPSF